MIFASRKSLMLAVVLSSVTAAALADAPVPSVVRLRADQVTLKAVDKRQQPAEREIQRAEVSESKSWPIKGKNEDGSLKVEVDGKLYTVAGVDVVTNELRTARTCVDKNTPKVGSTRGFDTTPCKP